MVYASYEKITEAVVTRTRHIVRIRLNESAIDIKETLKNVPDDAVVVCIDGDDEHGDYGQINFETESVS